MKLEADKKVEKKTSLKQNQFKIKTKTSLK